MGDVVRGQLSGAPNNNYRMWAHIYGLVLNNVKFEAHDYYYYSGYYASHYYNDPEVTEVVEPTHGEKR